MGIRRLNHAIFFNFYKRFAITQMDHLLRMVENKVGIVSQSNNIDLIGAVWRRNRAQMQNTLTNIRTNSATLMQGIWQNIRDKVQFDDSKKIMQLTNSAQLRFIQMVPYCNNIIKRDPMGGRGIIVMGTRNAGELSSATSVSAAPKTILTEQVGDLDIGNVGEAIGGATTSSKTKGADQLGTENVGEASNATTTSPNIGNVAEASGESNSDILPKDKMTKLGEVADCKSFTQRLATAEAKVEASDPAKPNVSKGSEDRTKPEKINNPTANAENKAAQADSNVLQDEAAKEISVDGKIKSTASN